LIVAELSNLRADLAKGREEGENIVHEQVAPFFELMIMESGIDKTDKSLLESVAKIAEMLFARIKEFIMIPNYKLKFSERKQLEGAIMDELDYCGIEKLKNKSGKLTAELISLGEKRESEVRNS
jgi:hypothetical protein